MNMVKKKIKLTQEQKDVITAINSKKFKFIAVKSNAGSAKSTSVVMALKSDDTPYSNGVIIAFNNKISKENEKIFPNWCDCRTIYSLAYKYIVAPSRLKIKSNIEASDINSGVSASKKMAVKNINLFCQSDFVKISDFLEKTKYDKQHKKSLDRDIRQVFVDMESGKIPITHSVYIKLFQLHLVNKSIKVEKFEFLFADEFQDFNDCMYSIFKEIEAPNKVVCGDEKQSIYKWAGATNAMQRIIDEPETKTLSLSRSFRCNEDIAKSINLFCSEYISDDMNFVGTKRSSDDMKNINTFGHQFRTNVSMISEMMKYQDRGIKFSLGRPVGSVFDEIIFIKIGAKREFKFMNENNGNHSEHYDSNMSRILLEYSKFSDMYGLETKKSFDYWLTAEGKKRDSDVNRDVSRIASIAKEFGASRLLSLKKYCLDKRNISKDFVVLSAHTAKGLSLGCVYIDEKINEFTEEAIDELSGDFYADKSELFLYYVACTRAEKILINARLLKPYYTGCDLTKDDFDRMIIEHQRKGKVPSEL